MKLTTKLGKLRCDHARPTCNRCRRRSLQDKCFYHPAPLTRALSQANAETSNHAGLASVNVNGVASDIASKVSLSGTNNKPSRRYNLDEGAQEAPTALRSPALVSIAGDQECSVLIQEVFTALEHFETLRQSTRDYYTDSMAANVPRPLILPAISSIERLTGVKNLSGSSQDGRSNGQVLVHSVASAIAYDTPISEITSPTEFLSFFTYSNIRLEFLGILYAIAGRGYLSSVGKTGVDDVFTRAMTRCCEICYRIARERTPMNDVITWLSLERVTLAMHVYGDQSEQVWRGLGDLSSDILAYSLHREASIARHCPPFIEECRRRTSSKAYYLDVCISATMNRPPRLCKKFFDVHPPLDLSDEDVCGTPETFAEAKAKLDPSGWNTDASDHFPASFARLRLPIAQAREEAWEYGLHHSPSESIAKLQDLSKRNRQIWDQIPSRLHYTCACWHSELAPRVCSMLMNMYLAWAATEFHICRAMRRADVKASGPLLAISIDIVTQISELGATRMKDAVYDWSFQALYHGWPAAVVLLENLQDVAATAPHAADVNAPLLIRLLSVLAYQFRTLCVPGQTNYHACIQAAEAIGSRLDDITAGLFDRIQRDGDRPIRLNGPDNDNISGDSALWSDPDMGDFLKDMDWNNISTEWGL